MKKILYMFALVAMVFATACSKEGELSHEGQGAVTFALSSTTTRNSPVEQSLLDMVKDKLMFRIYSVANKGEETETETLVRLYTYDEIIGDGSAPMQIWLLAGDYRVTVEGGEKSEASFADIYYKGATDFTVAESMTDQQIEIECRPANVMVKVVFDSSVAQNMGTTGKVTVAFAEADSYADVEGGIVSKSIPSLTYNETKTGYYYPLSSDSMPSKFVWRFSGVVAAKDDATVTKEGLYAPDGGFKAGYMYTLTFKYSPDLGGYLTLNVEVDDTPDEYSNTATFKPEPQFDSSIVVEQGYDNIVGEVAQMYSGKKVGYNIKAISAISELKISVDGNDLTYSASAVNAATRGEETAYAEYKDAANGVTIRVLNDKEWNLLLEPAFSQKLGAGKQEFVLTVTDESAAQAEYVQEYIGEGVVLNNLNTWMGYADMTVYINNPQAQNVQVGYKRNDGEMLYINAIQPSSGNAWSAKIPIDGVASTYEYCLNYTGMGVSNLPNSKFSTQNGPQVPNGGMEEWSQPKSPYLPWKNEQWWDSGNHGSTTLGDSYNITTPDSNCHSGQYSAKLQSRYIGIKFAAGNIFIGKYLETDGTDGKIGFGKPYNFTYKPKALRVWYKGKVGTINKGDHKSGSDKAQIYVWLCNWTGPHTVFTKDKGTFINPETTAKTDEGKIVGYGVWSREQTSNDNGNDNGWTMLEIPITYREGEGFSGVKPNYLVISCAASAYGDYFTGSTDSYMQVDDFEFVY